MDLVEKYLDEKITMPKHGKDKVIYQSTHSGTKGGVATVRMEFRGVASYSYTVDVEFPFKHAPIHKSFKNEQEVENFLKKQLGTYKVMQAGGSLSK